MAGVKTAISLDEELFNKITRLAHDMHVSRSRLVAVALKDYLQKLENQALLARLNDAYRDQPDEEERRISTAMQAKH